jgi:hypothetical protein
MVGAPFAPTLSRQPRRAVRVKGEERYASLDAREHRGKKQRLQGAATIKKADSVSRPAGGFVQDTDASDASRDDKKSPIGLLVLLRTLEPIEDDFAAIDDPNPERSSASQRGIRLPSSQKAARRKGS